MKSMTPWSLLRNLQRTPRPISVAEDAVARRNCRRTEECRAGETLAVASFQPPISAQRTGPSFLEDPAARRNRIGWTWARRTLTSRGRGALSRDEAQCGGTVHQIIDDGLPSQRADTTSVYDEMTTFDFVFILHLMKEIMEITDILCQALQSKSQDIINAMELVLSTKNLLQQMRDNKWNDLLAKVKSFCELRNIDIPDFNAPYINRRGRARAHQDNFTIEHHYQVDLFYASIDSQLQEINGRFNADAMELLILSNVLNPKNAMESFRIEDICKLVKKFYVQDFTSDEKEQLEIQLKHYEYNVVKGSDYKNLSTIPELCQWLVKTNKSVTYNLVFRVIILVLTLPVSTATTERSFSAMNIVKTRLRSKMEDAFLSDTLMVYIEREIAKASHLNLIK
ncbi:uncharacterized protein LOC141837084 [Curcuma longa]|uniref:uncharacterized protein LOC141837084 n=1 Tax=Curcuma longa TaxID=136217 RepID=UPI003D9FA662